MAVMVPNGGSAAVAVPGERPPGSSSRFRGAYLLWRVDVPRRAEDPARAAAGSGLPCLEGAPLRIGVISDTHVGAPHVDPERVRATLRRMNREEPT
jgi:hypothetical protein